MPQARETSPRVHSCIGQEKRGASAFKTNKILAKCTNRQLPVPVRCRKRTKFLQVPSESTFRLQLPSKNLQIQPSTCPSTSRSPFTPPRCQKSISMINLSPAKMHPDNNPRSEIIAESMRMNQHLPLSINYENEISEKKKKASNIICHVLAINAWRRRREEAGVLSKTVEGLVQQVDHLQLQIVVLRRLLETEYSRVAKLSGEIHRTKTQLESEIKQKDEITETKNKLELDIENLNKQFEERGVLSENLKNELLTIKSNLKAVDNQMSKEREKILKLQEDKKMLLQKVCANEDFASEQAQMAKKSSEELQGKFLIQVGIIDTLQENNENLTRQLKGIQVESIKLEKRLSSSEKVGKALSLRAANLEMQLGDREAALRRIESAYNLQLMEINELREQLSSRSQETRWSSKVLQIAGSVVRAPRLILRSLSLMSSTNMPVQP